MRATVGRIVHYYPSKIVCIAESLPQQLALAAIVTRTYDDASRVDLAVFVPGVHWPRAVSMVKFEETPTESCWTWPPRA